MNVLFKVLWGLVAVYAVATLVSGLFGISVPIPLLVLILVAFALIHGALRYGWRGIMVFIVVSLVVSNILENSSILTGFPFGHYHYTDSLGLKLFLVPVLIGPTYVAIGYLAWVLSTVLIGDVRRESSALTVFAVPFFASFMMVVWDLCLDPTFSTIQHIWIWEQGGGYFGVPLTNYLGWSLTVYLFYQLFALYLRLGKAGSGAGSGKVPALPREFYAQAVTMYAVVGLRFIVTYLTGSNTPVTDAAGTVWQTGSIYESAAIVSIYTMLFIAALSAFKLIQGQTAVTPIPTITPVTPIAGKPVETVEIGATAGQKTT
jgi:putative membrane protein